MPSLLHDPTLFEQILRMAIADYRFRHRDESTLSDWEWLSEKRDFSYSNFSKWFGRKGSLNESLFIRIVELLAGSHGLETESEIRFFAKTAGKDYLDLLRGEWWEEIWVRVRTKGTLAVRNDENLPKGELLEKIVAKVQKGETLALDQQYWAMSRELQLLLGAFGALPYLKSYELFVFTYLWGVSEEATLVSLSELGLLGWVSKEGEVWHIQPHVLKYAQKLFEELPRRKKTHLRDWAKHALRSDVYRRRRLKFNSHSYLSALWRNALPWREYPTYIFQRMLHPEEVSDLHTRGHHDRNFSQLDTLEFLYVWESHLRDIRLNIFMRLAVSGLIFGIVARLLEPLLPIMNFLSLLCAVVTVEALILFFLDGLRYLFQDLPRYEKFFPRK